MTFYLFNIKFNTTNLVAQENRNMLKLAKSVEYAILALKYISESPSGHYPSAREISERENIPYTLLAKILQNLVRKKILESVQGNRGGYNLIVDKEDLNLFRLANSLEQKIQVTECMVENATTDDCGRVETCCIRPPILNLQKRLENVFIETTLNDLIN